MDNEILKWIGGVAASVSITGIIGYLWRDSIGRIMTKSVDFQYEKKVELFKAEIREGEKSLEHKLERGIEAFKTDLREGEKEIEQVRAYLVSSRTGRDTILLEKKIQAAEDLLKIRKFLSGFNNAIDFLRVLDVDNLMKNGADEKIIGFTSAISKNLEIDSKLKEYSNFDSAITKLYLGEDVIKVFEIYERIVLQATALIKILEMPFGDKEDFIKHADLGDAANLLI
ncbi:hypothetical protein [Escherichia coli]|uniref:hypothetical protein n=1 Tax=Escherichia coli TaxID=562 RepID=UPI0013AF50AD|nr:hypothetical protein [Escherichia coli]MDI4459498.1 hypothetical protein [Escherichia coli]